MLMCIIFAYSYAELKVFRHVLGSTEAWYFSCEEALASTGNPVKCYRFNLKESKKR